MASKDLVVRLLGDASGLNQTLGRVGNETANVGRTLTRTLTPAAAAVGLALTKIGSDFNDARDAIIVGTGASGEALNGLIDSAKAVASEVPNSFGDVGQAVAEFNTRLGLTGEDLEDVSKLALDLSRITKTDVTENVRTVTRVMKDWGLESTEAAAAMDLLFKASQLTGIQVQRLGDLMVQFGAPLRQLGFSMEQSAALFASFEQQGVNTETVMSGLRKALGTMALAAEEPVETFQRVVQAIKDAGSAGEANALSLELFGSKAGPDMAAAIREGRFEIDELVDQLGDAEGSISYAAEETLRLTDRLAILRNRVTAALGPFGELGGAIAGGVVAIGPFLEGVSNLAPAIGKLITMVKGLNVAMLINPWVLAAAGIATLLAVSPQLRDALSGILSTIGDVVGTIASALKPAFDTLSRVVGDVARIVGDELSEAFQAIAPLLEGAATAIGELVSTTLPPMIDGFLAAVDAVVGLNDGVQGLLDKYELFPEATNAAGEQVGLFGIIIEGAKQAINPLAGVTQLAADAAKALGIESGQASTEVSGLEGAVSGIPSAFDEMRIIADLTATSTAGFSDALDEAGLTSEEFAQVTEAAGIAAQDALTREFGKIEDAAAELSREIASAAQSAANSFLTLSDDGKKNVDSFVSETISNSQRLSKFQDNVVTIASKTSGDFGTYLLNMGVDAEDLIEDLADPAKEADLQRAFEAWTQEVEIGSTNMGDRFAAVDPAFQKTLQGVAGLTESELQAIADIAAREGEAVGRDMINGMNAGVISRSPQLQREVRAAVNRAIEAGKAAARSDSPSKETRDEIGIPLAEGIAVGIAEGSSEVDRAMQAAVSDAIVPVSASAAARPVAAGAAVGSAGASFQITVNAGMGADGADIGRKIVEEIKKFERFNGARWRS